MRVCVPGCEFVCCLFRNDLKSVCYYLAIAAWEALWETSSRSELTGSSVILRKKCIRAHTHTHTCMHTHTHMRISQLLKQLIGKWPLALTSLVLLKVLRLLKCSGLIVGRNMEEFEKRGSLS